MPQFKNFTSGYRTNNIDINSLSAGQNVELLNTTYGRNIHMANGNASIAQITDEQVIGGFDYEKGDNHYHLIFTNDGTESKAYLLGGDTPTEIKSGMSADARFFNAVNYNNGVFVTNGIDAPFFYEYGATPAVQDITATDADGNLIRGLTPKVFDNRIFIGSGHTLYSCGLGDPFDWSSADVEDTRAGYIDSFMNRSSTITGIETYKDSLIIHRTTDTVWLSGTSGNYQMKVVSNVGCSNPFCIANLDIYQLYFLKHQNGTGLYYLSSNELGTIKAESEISVYVHEEFSNLDSGRLNEIYVLPKTSKNEVWIHLPRTDYPNNAYWLIYNLTGKFFQVPRITQPITSAWLYQGNIYTGTADGKILREDYGKTFDGQEITWSATTQSMDFGTLNKKAINDPCIFTVDGTRQNKFLISFILNDDEGTMASQEIDAVPVGGMFWAGDDTWTDPQYCWGANWTATIPFIYKQGKPSNFQTLKIRFSGENGSDIGLINFELMQAVPA